MQKGLTGEGNQPEKCSRGKGERETEENTDEENMEKAMRLDRQRQMRVDALREKIDNSMAHAEEVQKADRPPAEEVDAYLT